jgi:hypothetical protein
MDRQDTGPAARDARDIRPKSTWVDRVGERRTTHPISIPSGVVLELAQAAEDLRLIAAGIDGQYQTSRVQRLRLIAATLQTVSEQANT